MTAPTPQLYFPPYPDEREKITQHLTRQRLIARYGRDRARKIVNGLDPAANRDLAAWRRLGAKTT